MSRWDKLAKTLGKSSEELEHIFKNFNKYNSIKSIEDEGNITSKILGKNNKNEFGHVELQQHSPEMLTDVINNDKFITNNPFYLSEIQATQGDGLGKRLLDEALHQAQKQGADSVYLQADPTINSIYNQEKLTPEKLNEFYSKNKFVQPNKTLNPGSTPFVRNLEESPALDMSAEARFNRAMEQGYIPTEKNNILKNPETGNERSVNASFDPELKNKSGKYFGVGVVPGLNEFSEDIAQPLNERWEQLKGLITKPLSNQLDLTKDKSEAENLQMGLDIGLDPTNLVGGVPGAVLAGTQILGSKKDKK